MAYEYSQSAYSDTAYATYSAYLKSRIAAESATPSIAAASKSLSLTKALTAATKSNISATIQRENIQILTGNATLTDKYNVIAQEFVRAQSNGDLTLAQSLEGQAYSLSQRIQYQNQQSAAAGVALAKANAASQGEIVTNLESSLKQFNDTVKNTGMKDFNTVASNWVKANQATFQALGVVIPKGAQPNYWNLVNGVAAAMYNHDVLAGQALQATDPYAAQAYFDKATALHNGQTTISTLAGNVTAQEVQQAMSDPSMYAWDGSTGEYVKTQQSGYQIGQNGQVQPTYSGAVAKTVVLAPDQVAQMAQLGLSFAKNQNGSVSDGVKIQASASSPQWLKNVLGDNGVANIYDVQSSDGTKNYTLQFKADGANGQAIYTIGKDGTAWESTNTGDRLISGSMANGGMQSTPTSFFGSIGEAFKNGARLVDTLLSTPKAYADTLPSMVQAGTNHFTLPPIPVAKPMLLPSISVSAPQPQQALKVAPAPTIAPAVAPATANPQVTAPSTAIQGGSNGIQLQGGGASLQGGGGGISLQ